MSDINARLTEVAEDCSASASDKPLVALQNVMDQVKQLAVEYTFDYRPEIEAAARKAIDAVLISVKGPVLRVLFRNAAYTVLDATLDNLCGAN